MAVNSIDLDAMEALETALKKVVNQLPEKRQRLKGILQGVSVQSNSAHGADPVIDWATHALEDVQLKLSLARKIHGSNPSVRTVSFTDRQLARHASKAAVIDELAEDDPYDAAYTLAAQVRALQPDQQAIDDLLGSLDPDTLAVIGEKVLWAASVSREERGVEDEQNPTEEAEWAGEGEYVNPQLLDALEEIVQGASPEAAGKFADGLLQGSHFDDGGLLNSDVNLARWPPDYRGGIVLSTYLADAGERYLELPEVRDLTSVDPSAIDTFNRLMGDYAHSTLALARKEFRESAGVVEDLSGELVWISKTYGDNLSPEQLEKAQAEYRQLHAEAFEQYEIDAADLLKSLDGAAHILANPGDFVDTLKAQALYTAGEIDRLSYTEIGAREIADALHSEAMGVETFIRQIRYYSVGAGSKNWDNLSMFERLQVSSRVIGLGNKLSDAVIRSSALATLPLAQRGNYPRIGRYLRGVRSSLGPLVKDGELDPLIDLFEDPETRSLTPEEFSRRFDQRVAKLKGGLLINNKSFQSQVAVLKGAILVAKWKQHYDDKDFSKLEEKWPELTEDLLGTLQLAEEVEDLIRDKDGLARVLISEQLGRRISIASLPFDLVRGLQAAKDGDELRAFLSFGLFGSAATGVFAKGKAGPISVVVAALFEVGSLGLDYWEYRKEKKRVEKEWHDKQVKFLMDAGLSKDEAEELVKEQEEKDDD